MKSRCSGYMAPEYAFDGKFSIKSDVYSLGVVILEIVSGHKNRGFNHLSSYKNLLEQVSIHLHNLTQLSKYQLMGLFSYKTFTDSIIRNDCKNMH